MNMEPEQTKAAQKPIEPSPAPSSTGNPILLEPPFSKSAPLVRNSEIISTVISTINNLFATPPQAANLTPAAPAGTKPSVAPNEDAKKPLLDGVAVLCTGAIFNSSGPTPTVPK